MKSLTLEVYKDLATLGQYPFNDVIKLVKSVYKKKYLTSLMENQVQVFK